MQIEKLDLLDVRNLFDEVLLAFPHKEFYKYLSSTANIVHTPSFDSGVVKILQNAESMLTEEELETVKNLRKANSQINETSYNPEEQSTDFALNCLKRRKSCEDPNSNYIECKFLLPTSNVVERFLVKRVMLLMITVEHYYLLI